VWFAVVSGTERASFGGVGADVVVAGMGGATRDPAMPVKAAVA